MTTKGKHACMNIIRVLLGGRKKNETTIHLHNQLGQEGKQRMLANNKHNKSQVSDNHSNDDNHQPSKQRENKV